MRTRSRMRREQVVLAAVATLVVGGAVTPAAAPAQKRSAPKPASMVVDVPSAGDVSYAVIQVRRTSTKVPRSRRSSTRALAQTVGGLGFDVRSPAWRRLRATTKVYVATAPVQGAKSATIRNAIVFVVRRKPKKGTATPRTAKLTVRIPNATANRSFWVKSVSKSGRARVFAVRNILTTALGNWSNYLKVLASQRALRAAHDPVDVKGRFSQVPPQGTGRISTGGAKMNARTRTMYNLIFGTLGEPLSYQAAKKSPAVVEFIEKELGNRAVATRWKDIAGRLPLQVPDTYAAAARTEAQFTPITAPRISFRQVQIRDKGNSTEQAAIEAPRLSDPKVPGTRVVVQVTGSGTGTIATRGGEIACPPTCSHLFTSDPIVTLEPEAAPGSVFNGFDGCTGGVTGKGLTCRVNIVIDKPGPARIVVGNFRVDVPEAPPAPAGPTGPSAPSGPTGPTGLPPATLDPTFGFGGLASRAFTVGGSTTNAFANRIAVGPDGKLLLVGLRQGAGIADNDWATVRYTADGVLDSGGYSTDGTATLDETGVNLGGRDAAVSPTGLTYIVGESTGGTLGVFGVTATGTLNGAFGGGTAVVGVPGAGRVSGQAVAVQPDGKILVVGDADIAGHSHVVAARFLANGTVDTAFDGGGDGVVVLGASDCDATGGGGGCTVSDMELQTTGSAVTGIVISGSTLGATPGISEGVVLRLEPAAGTDDVGLDAAYGDAGTPGRRVLDPARLAVAGGMVAESTGAVVVSGRTDGGGSVPQCAVARLTATGAVDTAFGTGGSTTLALPDGCEAPGIARRAAGGYVLAGSDYAATTHAVLGRVTATGAPDAGFAAGGVRTVPSAGEPGFFNDVVLQGDRIVAAGGAFPFPHRFQVARYTGG